MNKEKFKKITFAQIEGMSKPFFIKNFILSGNMNFPSNLLFQEPFIVEGVVFALCTCGEGKIKVNFKLYDISPGCVIVLLPSQIAHIVEASQELVLDVLFVSIDFIIDFPLPRDFDILLNVGQFPCLHVSEESMNDLVEYHAMILRQYNQNEQPFRVEIVKGLLYAMLMELIGIYKMSCGDESQERSPWKEELVNRFFKLLIRHYRTERSVAFYADKLCLTTKYLSTTVKQVTGETVLSWIHVAIMIEAKALLRTTAMTVLQISDHLNFPNPSFFGKFFREHTGMTPTEFREEK